MRTPLLSLLVAATLAAGCRPGGLPPILFGFGFTSPAPGLLSLVREEPFPVRLALPPFGRLESLEVRLDGARALSLADGTLAVSRRAAEGSLPALPAGRYELEATAVVRILFFLRVPFRAWSSLERVALDRPDDCEILNDVECVLPFPSSRFLEPASTPTGVRVHYPEGALPSLAVQLDSAAFGGQDGFSPGVQVLTHFPGGVDPERSGASRLLADTRTHDDTSLRPDSPTLLLDATEGMKPVVHWVERDSRAADSPTPEREILFLRPGELLKGGHRYVVAMRNLVSPDGEPVEAEPVFAALRDRRPSDIPALEARRADAEALFRELKRAGVRRSELVLAFDFVVQSDEDLAGALLSMRDQAYDWLAQQPGQTFTVFPLVAPGQGTGNVSVERDCSVPGERTWREVRGRFEVPLFLSADPVLQPTVSGRLVDADGDGRPEPQGTMQAPFFFKIPCAVLDPAQPLLAPLLAGHGGFGEGRSAVDTTQGFGAVELAHGGEDFLRIHGATDWLGISNRDLAWFLQDLLVNANQFAALPDRLRQGVTNTLVLARMMREGRFNVDPAFRTPDGRGVFSETNAPLDYFGVSLGGIMGSVIAAVSPDVGNVALDVPSANISLIIQRSGLFDLFGVVIAAQNPDPIAHALAFGLGEELWDSAEASGYLHHVTRDPLPGSGGVKNLLYLVSRYDQLLPNEASEIGIRTLGLPNLRGGGEGSAVADLTGIPDVPPPLFPDAAGFLGASVWYDAGMYGDLSDPRLAALAPPLVNKGSNAICDPHSATLGIPALVRQLRTFLDDGVIENFCDGLCDTLASGGGYEPFELPGGASEPCNPLP